MITVGSPGYSHTQDTPAKVWTVTHNLKRIVVADVFINHKGALEKILASTRVLDNNTITITFSEPRSGVVRVV